jgi:putative transposase
MFPVPKAFPEEFRRDVIAVASGCWPRPNWRKTPCARWKILSPAARRRAVDMLKETLNMSERLACKAVGLARSTCRRLPAAQTPADPDADMRAWLRAYATKHPCHGFRRAWASLRYNERREVNKKKVHRLWREEGLQVRVRSPRKRAGVSSIPLMEADAPNVVWAIDFQFDSTTDGKAIKIASMIDEHTRESLLHLVERSITAERLVIELQDAFAAAGGPPKVLRIDNGPELVFPSAATVLRQQGRPVLHPAGYPVEQRIHQTTRL